MTRTSNNSGNAKPPARETFYALRNAELAKRHRILIGDKYRWLTLEEVIQHHLVVAQARGSKRAFKLSVMIRKLYRRPS